LCVLLALLGLAAEARDFSTVAPRTAKIVPTDHAVSIIMKKQTNPLKSSRLTFLFTTLGFPRFRATYLHTDSDALAYFKFRVGLAAALEFNDTGAPGFDAADRNSIVRKIDFLGKGTFWSTISCSSSTQNGIGIHTCSTFYPATATATSEKVTMTLSLADGYVRDAIRNRTLIPDGIKFDLLFENLVYHYNTTKIAFILALDSAEARAQVAVNDEAVDPSQPEASVTVGSGGRLNWVTRVQARYLNSALNKNSDLIASTLFTDTTNMTSTSEDDDIEAGESRDLLALTPSANDQPTTIEWDPTVFIDDQSMDTGAANQIVVSGFSVALIATLYAFYANLL